MTHMDAHANEYLAAVAGMAEHTMPSAMQRTYAEGDYVSGTSCGKPWSGRIEWFSDSGRTACINVGGGWLFVPVKDITF
jgi:hypothetical protein